MDAGSRAMLTGQNGERSIFDQQYLGCLLCDQQPAKCWGPRSKARKPTVSKSPRVLVNSKCSEESLLVLRAEGRAL